MPKHKPKHKLEKWFIISGDGVRPYVRTYIQNQPIKDETTFQASAWVGAWAWIIVRLKSCNHLRLYDQHELPMIHLAKSTVWLAVIH